MPLCLGPRWVFRLAWSLSGGVSFVAGPLFGFFDRAKCSSVPKSARLDLSGCMELAEEALTGTGGPEVEHLDELCVVPVCRRQGVSRCEV